MLTNKVILIISPQEWNSIKISKHYYAKELSNLNNKVYFLNPIKTGLFSNIRNVDKNIWVIDFKLPIPYVFKFKFRPIYDFILTNYFSFFLNKKKILPQIIWDFDNTHQFNNYLIFKGAVKIFHPVDALCIDSKKINKKPDIIFSVSTLILNKININVPKYFINHGLSNTFLKRAYKNLEENIFVKSIKNIGYSGNLNITALNYKLFESIVEKYNQINFHFIGPYDNTTKLYSILKKYTNTHFTGNLFDNDLVEKLNQMDILFYNYISNNKNYFSDNSHKILEYLSTGKIIIGNKLLVYENSDLILQSNNDKEFIEQLNEIIKNPTNFNSIDLNKKKIQFAISNSYYNQVKKIEKILIDNKLI